MIKKLIILLNISLFISISPAQAIENGEPVIGKTNAVAVGFDYHGGCGGFMYSPQILLVAAHCTYGVKLPSFESYPLQDNQVHVWELDNLNTNPIKSIKIYRPKDFRWQGTNGSWGYHNDFAVVILEKQIEGLSIVKIPSKEMFNSFVKNQSEATLIGLGKQYSDDARDKKPASKAIFNLLSQEEANKTITEYRNKWGKSGLYTATGHLWVPIGKVSPCDGDSGSPIFIQDKDVIWYLGAASFMLGTSNCGRGEWGNSGGIQSFYASYVYEDFIKEANNYLALNKKIESFKKSATKQINKKKAKTKK